MSVCAFVKYLNTMCVCKLQGKRKHTSKRGRPRFPVPGGGLLLPKSYVDVPAEPQKPDFLYTNFSSDYPPISLPFSIEKHPILPKLGAFYNNLLKIHPIFEFGHFRIC